MIRRILCFLVIAGVGCQRPKESVVIPAEPQLCREIQVSAYAPETDTFEPMYADSQMTIPLTNPIIISCDANQTFWVAGKTRIIAKVLP